LCETTSFRLPRDAAASFVHQDLLELDAQHGALLLVDPIEDRGRIGTFGSADDGQHVGAELRPLRVAVDPLATPYTITVLRPLGGTMRETLGWRMALRHFAVGARVETRMRPSASSV
jgi:hypothetical protein